MPKENYDDDSSTFVGKEPCPGCGSKDNLGRYSDGHAHCFGISCDYYERGDRGTEDGAGATPVRLSSDGGDGGRDFEPIVGTVSAIPRRGLSEVTCEFWDYTIGEFKGQPCQFANYRDPKTRRIVAQKVRLAGKDFPILKAGKITMPLFGQHLWKGDRRSLIITEGEIDALSVSQAQNNKYPVVSLPLGASQAVQAVRDHYEWLCEFDKIVLMFDTDEPGQIAAEQCAEILPVGKTFIADLGDYKDANEALAAGNPGAITSAFWNAKVYQPDGIFTLADIRDEVLAEVELGRPWFLPTLTALTYGRRPGEVYYFGAGTGVGKTDLFTQQIEFDVVELNVKTACIYLEQPPSETGKRIAGKHARKLFHIPNDDPENPEWTQGELLAAFDTLDATGNLFLGGNFASASWEQIKGRIRYLAVSLGVEHIFLDHLTALADPSNERESLEIITKELALMAQELGIIIHVISHLSTPDGKPHEEGGRVMLRHFKGSRAIGFWAHFAFGLERNPQDEDHELAQTTTFRCLKDRYTGRANGKTILLGYDTKAGIISERGPFESIGQGSSNLDV